jgi:hypothetical protein
MGAEKMRIDATTPKLRQTGLPLFRFRISDELDRTTDQAGQRTAGRPAFPL